MSNNERVEREESSSILVGLSRKDLDTICFLLCMQDEIIPIPEMLSLYDRFNAARDMLRESS